MGGNQDLHSGTFEESPECLQRVTLKTTQTLVCLFVCFRFNVPPQTQSADNEKAIREEFDKLHSFLVEEERNRLKVLRQEEEVKKQVMSEKLKSLAEQIHSLSATISDVELSLTERDLPFLLVCFYALIEDIYSSVGFR